MNIYVGNLAWKATNEDLQELFSHFGEVDRAVVIKDRESQRSKGFGFVEMSDKSAAQDAIENLNNTVFMERTLVVNEARPRQDN